MIEKRRDITKRYSFPSVNVTEVIRTPIQPNVEWRNVIGVAAPFSKGPRLARISSDRKELVSLFGEDDSIGSMFIQQALLQGASEFVISRVLPESKSPQGLISLTPATNSQYIEAKVSPYGHRTTGLTFKSSLISKFLASPGSYSGIQTNNGTNSQLEIRTNTSDVPAIELDGVCHFDLIGKEIVNETILTTQEVFKTSRKFKVNNLSPKSGVFKIQFGLDATLVDSQTDEINQLLSCLKPGFALAPSSTGLTVTGGQLEILSYPQETKPGEFELLVKGAITAVSTGTNLPNTFTVVRRTGGTESFTVIGVKFRSNSTRLPGLVIYANDDYISYIIAPHNSSAGTSNTIVYYTSDTPGTIEEENTGVTAYFGTAATNATARVSYKLAGTITVFNTEVEIGATTLIPGQPTPPEAFPPNMSVLDIYEELRRAILANTALGSLFSDVEINNSKLPYSLSFKLQNKGTRGNDIQYAVKLTKTDASADDLNVIINGTSGDNVYVNMVGGADSIKAADATFYDVRGNALVYVQAVSPGVSGNNISINIKPVRDGEFILEAVDTNPSFMNTVLPSESYYLSNLNADLETGVYPDTLTSNLIRAYFIPLIKANAEIDPLIYKQVPSRIAPPDPTVTSGDEIDTAIHVNYQGESFLQNIRLSGGAEPSNYPKTGEFFAEDDYIEAINRLKEEDVFLIAAPGIYAGDTQYSNAINTLVKQAEESTPYEGLRFAVVSTPPRLTPSRARIIANSFNSDRVVLLGGHSRVAGLSGNSTKLVSPEGFYAGYIVNLEPHVSPAAQATNTLNGVLSLDTKYTLDELDSLTKSNIELLHLDPVTKTYRFLNGRTSSSMLSERWISLRRYADHLIMTLFRNLQWAKAMPNDSDLRTKIASACDAFLRYEKSRGYIMDYSPTIADETVNTPQDLLTGNLNILLRYIPKVPADYINLTVIRDFSTQFSINV